MEAPWVTLPMMVRRVNFVSRSPGFPTPATRHPFLHTTPSGGIFPGPVSGGRTVAGKPAGDVPGAVS